MTQTTHLRNISTNTENVADNRVPNLTVFGQRFADISPNEVACADHFGPLCRIGEYILGVYVLRDSVKSGKASL